MSLLKNKNNNSGIKQLNQIENEINNINNKQISNKENNVKKNNEITNEDNYEVEQEDDEEEEEENSNNINGEEFNEENIADENEEEEEDDEDNLSILESYKYKLNYIENIELYPRPKTNYILYKNSKNNNDYISNPNNKDEVPSVRAYYTNIEELNSSLKLIRPSQYIIPYNCNNLKKSLNLFGINVEPFSIDEKQNSVEFIQKIYISIKNKYVKNVLKCEHCNAYYHKLYCNCETISNNGLYQTNKLYCFFCKNNSNFYSIVPISNNVIDKDINLDKGKIFLIPNNECNKPSIEYIIKDESEKIIIRNTIQILVIDISNKNFLDNIYQNLIKILKQKYENDNKFKFILICYDINKIYYIYFSNNLNKTINITIMNDLNNPFCPVDPKKIIYSKNDFIELLDNFYNLFILNKNINNNILESTFNYNDINNSIIKSVFCLIKINKINENMHTNIINYYHIIFISSFHHNIDTNILSQNKIYKIFLSFFLISNKSNKNIPFMNNLKITNAKLYYYPIQYDDPSDIEQKYQKFNDDLTLLLTKYKNYIYEINMTICYDKNLFQNYLNDDSIYISFNPNINQFNKLYILPQYKKPNLKESIYIQYNIEFNNLFDNNRHIRILNFINTISDNQIEIFKSYDEEVLFRIVLANHITELNLDKNNFASINKLFLDISNKKDILLLKIIKDIQNKIKVNLAKNYRFGDEKNNIYTPLSCKFFPLFLYSFVKQISNGTNLNLFNILYDSPIATFMKNIYPTLLNLGYKLKKQEEVIYLHSLSILFLERNQLLLIDDGMYITILINNEINKRKKEHFFKTFDEKNSKFTFYSESPVLKDIINNKPMKIIFLDDENILNKRILDTFLEDNIIKDINAENTPLKSIDNINEYIQNDVNYPYYYEILTGNIYEFLE